MADEKPKFCPRCGHKGTRTESADSVAWSCADHGVIWKEAKPPVLEAAPEPGPEDLQAEAEKQPSPEATGAAGEHVAAAEPGAAQPEPEAASHAEVQ